MLIGWRHSFAILAGTKQALQRRNKDVDDKDAELESAKQVRSFIRKLFHSFILFITCLKLAWLIAVLLAFADVEGIGGDGVFARDSARGFRIQVANHDSRDEKVRKDSRIHPRHFGGQQEDLRRIRRAHFHLQHFKIHIIFFGRSFSFISFAIIFRCSL